MAPPLPGPLALPPALAAQPRLAALWAQVLPALPTTELAHDAAHVLRVVRWCARLAPELGADPELAVAAGMVHDLVAVPKDSPLRSTASLLSAATAGPLLTAAGFETPAQLAVVAAVRSCSWSAGHPADSPLARVLQDADRLDAIGVVGAFRNIAVAQDMGARSQRGAFFHPTDPLAQSDRELDDRRWALDHWRVKLLGLAAGMHSATARREAARRKAHMLLLLDMLEHELSAAARTGAGQATMPA